MGKPHIDEDRFWGVIEQSRTQTRHSLAGDDRYEQQLEALEAILASMTPVEVLGFDVQFRRQLARAYTWLLWGAAYVEGGGCSDDGFMDFRSTLISLGRVTFERVLADPDELASLAGNPEIPTMQSEGIQYVAAQVYEDKTGGEMPHHGGPAAEPSGEEWDFDDDDENERRLPRLTRRMAELNEFDAG